MLCLVAFFILLCQEYMRNKTPSSVSHFHTMVYLLCMTRPYCVYYCMRARKDRSLSRNLEYTVVAPGLSNEPTNAAKAVSGMATQGWWLKV